VIEVVLHSEGKCIFSTQILYPISESITRCFNSEIPFLERVKENLVIFRFRK